MSAKQVFLIATITFFHIYSGQPQTMYGSTPLVSTYSIVARDPDTGEMGVAVQSHWFSVGTIVSWGEAGIGVIATQSFVNVSFGLRGLELLRSSLSPREALDQLLSTDEGKDVRQVAILDSKGRIAVFTGENCIPEAGHISGDNFSAQANMMLNDKVWPAMAKAFETTKGPLSERMLAALKGAEEAGGDIRGKQSAALLVVRGKSTGKPWEDRLIDIQIADHPEPLKELERILKVHRAYEKMNNGDLAVERGDFKTALKEYSAAEDMFPENLEMKYWHAVSLVNMNRIDDAVPLFKEVFAKDPNWKILTPRLITVGLLEINKSDLYKLLEE